MKEIFYKFFIQLSKRWGTWIFIGFAWTVATGYFLFFPLRLANSVRFYRVLFPNKTGFYHIWCAWQQYHYFTYVFMDRFLFQELDNISYTSQGWEYLDAAVKNKQGGIILMSHAGNWEVAAHLLKQTDIPLLLYMGVKHKEQIEQIQKKSLAQTGVKIIAVEEGGGSPLDIIEGIDFLKSGGLVSLTGDKVWRKNQPVVPVQFLGRTVFFPEMPYMLALLSNAPLFIFFTFRMGKQRYHFISSKAIYVQAGSRSERKQVIQKSAQKYADILEQTLRQHPFEWYHFEPFFGDTNFDAVRFP